MEARVIRQHYISVRAVTEQADDGRMFAFDDLHDAAFGATVGSAALNACENSVAMHRIAEVVAPDEKIALHARHWRIGDQKRVAIAVGHDSTGN